MPIKKLTADSDSKFRMRSYRIALLSSIIAEFISSENTLLLKDISDRKLQHSVSEVLSINIILQEVRPY